MTGPPTPFGQRPAVESVRAFACPSCGGPIELRAPGITVTAICRQCSTIIDTAHPDLRVIQKARTAAYETFITLGSRGELFGHLWEVIGHTRKSVVNTEYNWGEYLLFNPWEGFRFLSASNGHWTFFKRLNRDVAGIGQRNSLFMDGRTYNVFSQDQVQVDGVQGEFYWRVKQGDLSRGTDYICPPYMLSCEETNDERNISLGTYVPVDQMRRAFPDARLPVPNGIGACQPAPIQTSKIVRLAWMAAAAAIVLHICVTIAMPSQQMLDLANQTIKVKPSAEAGLSASKLSKSAARKPSTHKSRASSSAAAPQPAGEGTWNSENAGQNAGQPVVTESFTLPRAGNIVIDIATRLDNSWADFDLTLVNEVTNATYPMQTSISEYHGYDDGESWSEGHNSAQTALASVPAGRYHLLIDAESEVLGKTGALPFSLTLRRQVTELTNLLFALFLLPFYPFYAIYRRWSFESARWANSDYSPGNGKSDS